MVNNMGDDIVKRMRDMERILGEMQDTGLGLMDSLLRDAFSPDNFLRYAASLGIDLSQFPNMVTESGGSDPYQFLCLEKTATEAEVKKRYRKLMRVLHPDTTKTEGTNRICQMVNEAYQQILKERGWR
jgi:DnaJ-domain-containing protein 1